MASIAKESIPLLPGDRLTLRQFLRRWQDHPEIKRAELLGGIVYMPSPVGVEHSEMENIVATWLGNYRLSTPGCTAGNNATTILKKNSPQPDVFLRLLPEAGGGTNYQKKLLKGPPEFVAEICASSASYDLHQKYDIYENAGVKEYLAVLMYESEIRWHRLEGDEYVLEKPDRKGIYQSIIFPGLWLNGPALLKGDIARVMATLQEGLGSEEHARFVKVLKKRMAKNVKPKGD